MFKSVQVHMTYEFLSHNTFFTTVYVKPGVSLLWYKINPYSKNIITDTILINSSHQQSTSGP